MTPTPPTPKEIPLSAAQEPEFVPTPLEVFQLKEKRMSQLDTAGQAALFAVDGVMEFPFAPVGTRRRLVGRDEIGRVLSEAVQVAQGDGVRLVGHTEYVVHETLDPEVIVVEFEAVGESPTGERKSCPYIQVLRVRNGEIVLFRDYWCMDSALRFWGAGTAAKLKEES